VRVGGIPKGFISIENLVEFEAVGNQLRGVDLLGFHDAQQHRRADRVDQPGGDGDVSVPEIFQMEIHFGTMHADIGDDPTGRDDLLTKLERRGNADRLDRSVHPPRPSVILRISSAA